MPLIDGRISVAQRAAIADRFVHVEIENQEQAVEVLVASDRHFKLVPSPFQ